MPPRIPDETRESILADLEAENGSTHEIAERHGVGQASVSRIAKGAGITLDRAKTENATKAQMADNRALRAELSRRLLVKASDALDQMDQPHRVFAFGGKENTFNDEVLDRPPTGDMRNLMVIAATAIDKHIVIDRHDSGAGVDEAVSLLDRIMGGLKSKHGDNPDAPDAHA